MGQTKTLAVVLVTSAFAFFGCSEEVVENGDLDDPQVGQTAEALRVEELPSADYVRTPNGFAHKSCVHALPEGADVDTSEAGFSRAMSGGREIARYAKCAYPSYRRGQRETLAGQPESQSSGRLPFPTWGGWMRWYDTVPVAPATYFDQLHAVMTVPAIPAATYNGSSNDQLVYIFPSVQNNHQILQPVLQYGGGAGNSGAPWYTPTNIWTVAVWLVDDVGGYWYSPSINALPGDQIVTDTTMQAFGSGSQTWSVGAQNLRTGQITSKFYYGIPTTTGFLFNRAQPLALEAYGLTACNQLPTSMTASAIYILQGFPNWNSYIDPGSAQSWWTPAGASPCSTSIISDRGLHSAPNTVTITVP